MPAWTTIWTPQRKLFYIALLEAVFHNYLWLI
jgi:hypothetical protein